MEGCVCVYKDWGREKPLLSRMYIPWYTTLCTFRRQVKLVLNRSSKVMHFNKFSKISGVVNQESLKKFDQPWVSEEGKVDIFYSNSSNRKKIIFH